MFRDLLEAPDFAVVDAHHHLWDLGTGRYPWLQDEYRGDTFMGDYRRLCRSYGPAQYRADMRGLRIGATVHVEAERARDESLAETQWLAVVAAEHPELACAVVPWVDLWADDVAERIDKHLGVNPRVRGIRAKPRIAAAGMGPATPSTAHGSLRDARLSRGFDAMISRELAWDLRVPWCHLAEAAERLADVPQLTVVLNHAGLPWDRSEAGLRQWLHAMQALAGLPRVFVKLSEFSAPAIRWNALQVRRIVDSTLDLFGPQRCMFASNLPVAGLAVDMPTLVRAIAEAVQPCGDAAMRAVFMGTACTAYRLDPSAVSSPHHQTSWSET